MLCHRLELWLCYTNDVCYMLHALYAVKCNVGPESFNRINDLGGKIKGVKEVKTLDGRNKRIKVEIASQIGETRGKCKLKEKK